MLQPFPFIAHAICWSLRDAAITDRRFNARDWNDPQFRGRSRTGGFGGFARGRLPNQRLKFVFPSLRRRLRINRRRRRDN